MFVQRIGSLTSGKVSSNSSHSNPNVAFAAKPIDVPDEFTKGAKEVVKNVEKIVTKSSDEVVPETPKKRGFWDWVLGDGNDSDPFNPENIQYP